MLTDLYSDPEYAIIREYATNGYDAHIEAGMVKPIEVTTPTALSPYLTVRDFGVGLSVEDIHEIYSKYGASTKRETNAQVGMLGLGCKSALTYSPQFTITSVQNGTLISVSVSRDEDGAGSMTIVDTRTTDEADGTTITIPTKSVNNMEGKARRFFSYWPEGSVLLNGETPRRFEGLKVNDHITIVQGINDSKVVMGNVPYPATFANDDGQRTLPHGVSLVAYVPIGDVHFAPSQEALRDTAKTKATLARLTNEYSRDVKHALQREIDKAATPAAAVAKMVEWQRYIPRTAQATVYRYKGMDLPREYRPGTDKVGAVRMVTVSQVNRYSRGHSSNDQSVPAEVWPKTVWIRDFARPSSPASTSARRSSGQRTQRSRPTPPCSSSCSPRVPTRCLPSWTASASSSGRT